MKKYCFLFSLILVVVSVVPSFAERTLSDEDIDAIAARIVELIGINQESLKQAIEDDILAKLSVPENNNLQSAAELIPAATATPEPTKIPEEKYIGAHVKQVNAYAYVTGGSHDGQHTYKNQYYPNELFTLDVVFENDGNAPLPRNLELRHTGGVGEYTCHTESAYSYKETGTMPDERVGFSFSCHGSENIGTISFYFTLFDSSNGNSIAVPGGFGYYTYVAAP